MVRLTKLKIDRFRNVKPGTVLEFGPTFNVLLGKNATGKTTLLDLIAAVTNDDLSACAKEEAGFDLTWWIEKGELQIEVRAVRDVRGRARPHLGDEREFDERLMLVLRTGGAQAAQIEVVGTRGTLTVRNESPLQFDVGAGLATGSAIARALPAACDEPTPAAPHLFAALEMVSAGGHLGRFDEAVASLDAITRSFLEIRRRDTGGFGLNLSAWVPGGVVLAADALMTAESLVLSFDDLGSLEGIPAALGFSSGELLPRLLRRSQEGTQARASYQGFDFLFRRADGSQISHELLSFGQKRLFSFLWYLAVRRELPVVADELLNGLHHEWIEVCLERLYERQSFLAAQHPYLLDHVPIESGDGVRKTFIRCKVEPGPDGREQMVWRNFTEDEAERFFIAYQTGIPQVSEVLMTEGLW